MRPFDACFRPHPCPRRQIRSHQETQISTEFIFVCSNVPHSCCFPSHFEVFAAIVFVALKTRACCAMWRPAPMPRHSLVMFSELCSGAQDAGRTAGAGRPDAGDSRDAVLVHARTRPPVPAAERAAGRYVAIHSVRIHSRCVGAQLVPQIALTSAAVVNCGRWWLWCAVGAWCGSGGDLFGRLNDAGKLEEPQAKTVFLQLLRGESCPICASLSRQP